MKLLINILLSIIARLGFYFLGEFFYITGLIFSKNRSKYHLNIGISYDQLANTVGAPLLNIILRKKGGYQFGNPDDTLSAVLGRLKHTGHLKALGRFFAWMLNKIEKNHVEKAAKISFKALK
jgi:hypothetical protein